MSLGSLLPSSQQRRLPRRRLISPWLWDIATAIGGIAIIAALVAMIVLYPDMLSDLRGWHVALVVGH